MNNILKELPIRKFVIVGSYPLNIRYSKDIDVICYKSDVEVEFKATDDYIGSFDFAGRRIELLFADKQESLGQILNSGYLPFQGGRVATNEELFCIKAGHIVFPHKQWDKHIHDYHYLRQIINPIHYKSPWMNNLIALHRKCTKERLKIRTPKLIGVTKDEFFDDLVKKHYVHDNIHYAMAHKERPMYEYMQDDPNIVACNKNKWENFTEEEKIWTVLEESYVIALERHIIPTMKGDRVGLREFDAFKWALYRICTTLTSGWFREFAVENYYKILNQYNKNYVQKFLQNIEKYERVKV